ncbi:DUF5007 domain-containing protein [Sphingobacterium sp. LRF_L2]|uniref:DUF5007 domain-containing protein n=1 Tax=Sphingobacterium sp. LRF_L2 TaxID=3369421 RepID=UPI003F5FDD57
MLKNKIVYRLSYIIAFCSCLTACNSLYDLPSDKDFISDNLTYSTKILEPTLGRTTVFSILNADNSTLPMRFEIVNPRFGDGRAADDFLKTASTYEWITEYDGEEKSLEEIEAKRHLVEKPMFEVDSNGRFILWASATNDRILPRPSDTTLKTQDIRFFDLKLSNSGGIQYVKDFQFIPWREIDYSPETDVNIYTGGVAPDPNSPKDPRKRAYILPTSMGNLVGEQTNVDLVNNNDKKDLVVYIRKFEGGNGHNLRLKFLDKDSIPIDPANFNETRWDQLLHAFNRVTTSEYVQYDVAYPVPLTSRSSFYTVGGNAKVDISYSRKGWGGVRTTGFFGLQFKIFKAGDWEVVFHFRNDNPKFDDE